MSKKEKFLALLSVISCFFFSCGDKKKNGSNNPQQTNVKSDTVTFYRTIENFPIFNSKSKEIRSEDKAKLEKILKSRSEDFKPFLTATNISSSNDIEKNLLVYRKSFYRWLKSRCNKEKFRKIVSWDYLCETISEQNYNETDAENVRKYSAFLKAKLADELSSLRQIEVFCDEIDRQDRFEKNKRILLFAYIIVVQKDFDRLWEVFDRVVSNNAFCSVLNREEIIETVFLCFDPSKI